MCRIRCCRPHPAREWLSDRSARPALVLLHSTAQQSSVWRGTSSRVRVFFFFSLFPLLFRRLPHWPPILHYHNVGRRPNRVTQAGGLDPLLRYMPMVFLSWCCFGWRHGGKSNGKGRHED